MQATCDSACQPQPITPRLLAPLAARCFAATPLAAPVRSWPSLSASMHRDELGRVRAKEEDGETRPVAEAGVDLRARVAELEVGGGHDRERSFLEPEPVARSVLDAPRGHAAEARLDRLHGVGRREEPGDVLLAQIEGHARIVAAGTMKCARHESNLRPLPPQGSALSPELRALGTASVARR